MSLCFEKVLSEQRLYCQIIQSVLFIKNLIEESRMICKKKEYFA